MRFEVGLWFVWCAWDLDAGHGARRNEDLAGVGSVSMSVFLVMSDACAAGN